MNPERILTTAAFVFAIGAQPSSAAPPLTLRDLLPVLESRYAAEVVAIALDESGDKAPHYHVELRYPGASIATVDIDAATLAASAHRVPSPSGDGWALVDATAAVEAALGGEAIAAAIGAGDGEAPHYDVDLRLATGYVARIKLDATTGRLEWRVPPVVPD